MTENSGAESASRVDEVVSPFSVASRPVRLVFNSPICPAPYVHV